MCLYEVSALSMSEVQLNLQSGVNIMWSVICGCDGCNRNLN
jgi:hypothetical protein